MRLFFAALVGTAVITGAACAELLTREQALQRALGDDPGVLAAAAGQEAAEALARQAGARANPTLEVQLEDFAGSNSFSGVDSAQATYSLAQEFSLGGDRRAKKRAAEQGAVVAGLRAGLSRADLQEAVELAFVDAQAAVALVDVALTRFETARDLAATVDRRVVAARDPAAARSRTAAQLAEAMAALDTAQARARAAKAALASYWGGEDDFELEALSLLNAATRAASQYASPDLALSEAARVQAEAQVDLERAKQAPDPTLRAGFRQLRETDSSAFIVGVSVPLPVWNRNSGAIAAARADATRAGYELKARERALARETAYLAAQADAARAEIAAYEGNVIPNSERARAEAFAAYSAGGLSYIDVLDAEAALTLARERQIAALLMFHRSEIRLARLNGAIAGVSDEESPR